MHSKLFTTLSLYVTFVVTFGFPLQISAETSNTDPHYTILVFGDSISAAYGMAREEGWVSLLNQQLLQKNHNYQVINASVSGETTGGGLIRLPKMLEIHQPDIIILELGGNDGLRGYPIYQIQENLQGMIDLSKQVEASVLLVGMVLPPNYGNRYTIAFETLFQDLAAKNDVEFLPFLLEGVTTPETLIQRDGIHPKPEAQPMLLNDIWQHLEKMLE